MDIKFTFVYDTKNNSFLLKKPDKKSKKYHKTILANFKNKYYKTEQGQRVEIDFGKDLKIYMIKKNIYTFGILGPKTKTKIPIYKYLDEFYKKYKALGKKALKIKRDDPIIIWIKEEMKAFKEGQRKTVTERIDDRLRSATVNLENQLTKAMEMNTQLILIDDEVEEIKEVALENKEVAKDVKNEAWWLNQKLTLLIFGMVGVFVLFFGLWIVHEIL